MQNLISFGGIFVMMACAWALSTDRRIINWRLIIWGVIFDLAFAFFVFVIPAGGRLFLFANDMVVRVLDSAGAGTRFVFGRLALSPGTTNESGEGSLGFILAFQALPTIIFFACLMSVLYYIGLMPWLIKRFSLIFTRLMRISGAEALSASSNIFVGVESALTIRPHLVRMTRSELCCVLTVGMATISSNIMALHVFVLREQFPTIAGHLMSASFLSATGGIIMSKLLVPETGAPETLGMAVEPSYERGTSVIEAIINGANEGLKLILGIIALLLAFLGLAALFDAAIGAAGSAMGVEGLSISGIFAYVFYPLTLAIGVPASDAMEVSRLLGERVIATEVKAYQDLAVLMASHKLQSPRSAVLAAYALCGFAHVASLAIFVGGTAAIAPSRTGDISAVGPRALVAATLACLMTAAVAGVFYTDGSILFGGG